MTQIKSEKAIAYIEQHTADGDIIYPLTNDQVAEVISIAEAEADERLSITFECKQLAIIDLQKEVAWQKALRQREMLELKDRAMEAFKKACSCVIRTGRGAKCDRFINCARYKCFINELNK